RTSKKSFPRIDLKIEVPRKTALKKAFPKSTSKKSFPRIDLKIEVPRKTALKKAFPGKNLKKELPEKKLKKRPFQDLKIELLKKGPQNRASQE
ncbi:hypothetical protein BpHYR1_048402, partial [Brachionus plicatilis]